MIQLDDVSLAYEGRTGPVLALQGTSISVAKGEFAAVVGPSGCGKSTLIVEPYRSNFRRKKDEYRARAETLLDTVGLKGFGDRFPWELSGGMQQRASLCRSLIHEPALLMLDEPFAALDAFTREELWCVMRDVWERLRFTVVLVTHDLREAAFLADTIHVMSARPGRIIETRKVDFPRPRSLDVCYEPEFSALVLSLRNKIAEVRQS